MAVSSLSSSSFSVNSTNSHRTQSLTYKKLADSLGQDHHQNYLDMNNPEVERGLASHIAKYKTTFTTLPQAVQDTITNTELGQRFLQVLDKSTQGTLTQTDMIDLQAFLQGVGLHIGGAENVSGIDGLFGPRTFQGLNEAFELLNEHPQHAFEHLQNDSQWIKREVSHVRSHLSAEIDPIEVSFSSKGRATPSTSIPDASSSHQHPHPTGSSNSSVLDTGYKDIHGRSISLSEEALVGFEKVLDITRQKGVRVEVFSSYRSVAKQQRLFNQAIRKYGSVQKARKWVAPPGKSRHNYGNAIDLNMYRNGKKIPQKEFDTIIAQAGMYRPMSWETWHIEPLSTRQSRGIA